MLSVSAQMWSELVVGRTILQDLQCDMESIESSLHIDEISREVCYILAIYWNSTRTAIIDADIGYD